jgi:hypothetical protein
VSGVVIALIENIAKFIIFFGFSSPSNKGRKEEREKKKEERKMKNRKNTKKVLIKNLFCFREEVQ